MAQQVYYNYEKRFGMWDMGAKNSGESLSMDRNLNIDKYSQFDSNYIKLMGRTLIPPYGYLDERAKVNGEYRANGIIVYEPRAQRGTVVLQYLYLDPYKLDTSMIYVPSLRRIRKMAATDTQDPLGDLTYDDNDHISQKITPKKYPYQFDITAEREYLMLVAYDSATAWVDSKDGYALKGAGLMRRPCYVLQMTQLDPNYVYSKRILYIDKENFIILLSANYDQKGRLYRTKFYENVFMLDTAQFLFYGTPSVQLDHIDLHSTFQATIPLPATFTRQDFGIQELIKRGK